MSKTELVAQVLELHDVAEALLEYIDALPETVVATLPAMPGINRDYVENVLNADTITEPIIDDVELTSVTEAVSERVVDHRHGQCCDFVAESIETIQARLRQKSTLTK